MRRSLQLILVLAASAAFTHALAHGGEGMELSQKSKMAAAAPVPAKNAQPPFNAAREILPFMVMQEVEVRRGAKNACENTSRDLCYDLADHRVVYKPVRQYMPRVDGLTAENVSVRHDKVVFKYTFR